MIEQCPADEMALKATSLLIDTFTSLSTQLKPSAVSCVDTHSFIGESLVYTQFFFLKILFKEGWRFWAAIWLKSKSV